MTAAARAGGLGPGPESADEPRRVPRRPRWRAQLTGRPATGPWREAGSLPASSERPPSKKLAGRALPGRGPWPRLVQGRAGRRRRLGCHGRASRWSRRGLRRPEVTLWAEEPPGPPDCGFHLATRVGELHLGVSSAVSQGSPTVPCGPGDEAHPNSLNRSRPTEGAAARF